MGENSRRQRSIDELHYVKWMSIRIVQFLKKNECPSVLLFLFVCLFGNMGRNVLGLNLNITLNKFCM